MEGNPRLSASPGGEGNTSAANATQGVGLRSRPEPYRLLDLFSGIGGFSLGLERTGGFKTVAFCEIEDYPRKVLHKHWPEVPIYDDVRTLTADRLRADGIVVDVICGGFPCQDISVAGKGAGIDGERSGLWSEYARLIGELRPRYVLVENVAALLGRGLDRVLGDLAALGFDAEWHCIPASAVGAPHRRDRLWLVAHSSSLRSTQREEHPRWPWSYEYRSADGTLANADRTERQTRDTKSVRTQARSSRDRWPSYDGSLPDAGCSGLEGQWSLAGGIREELNNLGNNSRWFPEPDVGRVAHGISSRVDRLKSLGNAVVPAIPELLGRAILASERQAA